jgi:hypothetical protein
MEYEKKMLETSEERIKILKKGFSQKQIEEMYIQSNDLKIVSIPILVDLVEMDSGYNNNTCETVIGSAQSLGLAVASIFNVSRFKSVSPTIQ